MLEKEEKSSRKSHIKWSILGNTAEGVHKAIHIYYLSPKYYDFPDVYVNHPIVLELKNNILAMVCY